MENLPKNTNIIIVNDFDYTQGGASKVAIDTANLLVESINDINVYFFSGAHKETSNLNQKVIKVCTNQGEALRDKNKIRGFFNGIYNFKARKELKKLLKSLDRENTIIHVHGWTKCLSSSVFDIAFKMKFKVVLTLHDYFTACPNGGYFNYKKNEICNLKPLSLKCIKCNCDSRSYSFKLYRVLRQIIQNKVVKLNNKLENVITISDFSEKILKETLNAKIKITRIYNPIDLDENNKKVDLSKNKYYLYVGRVSKEKGVDLFCKSISDLKLEGIVVGDGDQKSILEKQYPNIEFVGWKNNTEVKKYMLGAKALIFPSRWYETMGLTVVEALSLNIPVIVSSNTSAVEFLNKENIYNIVFDNNLTDKIIELEKKLTKKIETFDNKVVLETFAKTLYINKLIELYTEIGDISE